MYCRLYLRIGPVLLQNGGQRVPGLLGPNRGGRGYHEADEDLEE